MKNWFSFPPLAPRTYALYAFFLMALSTLLVSIPDKPIVLASWGMDGLRYSRDLLTGIVAFFILTVIIILLIRKGIQTLTRIERLSSATFIFCFLVIPVFNIYILGSASSGFTISPSSQPHLAVWYQHAKDIQTNVTTILLLLMVTLILIIRFRESKTKEMQQSGA